MILFLKGLWRGRMLKKKEPEKKELTEEGLAEFLAKNPAIIPPEEERLLNLQLKQIRLAEEISKLTFNDLKIGACCV